MNTFQNILIQIYSKYTLNPCNMLIFNFLYTVKLRNNLNTKNKYKLFNSHVLHNKLLSNKEKNTLLEIFNKTQKYYHIFLRFSHKYRLLNSSVYDNLHDLNFNLLSEFSDNLLTTIYESSSNIKYKFKITDLINIINSSLCYMENFVFKINSIKNPYTNIPFTDAMLYNIYFTIKNSSFVMPKFFHLFFLDNFNKDKFYINNECIIKTETLSKYVKNMNKEEKLIIINEMLTTFNNGIFVLYNEQIKNNKDELIELFEICIKDFIFINYSNNLLLIQIAKDNLSNQMIKISQKNIKYSIKIILNNNFLSIISNYIKKRNINLELNQIGLISENSNLLLYKLSFLFFVVFKIFIYCKFIVFLYNELLLTLNNK